MYLYGWQVEVLLTPGQLLASDELENGELSKIMAKRCRSATAPGSRSPSPPNPDTGITSGTPCARVEPRR